MSRGLGLSLHRACVHYGDLPALDGVDLELEPGSTTVLVGPSGAGKTTLLRVCGAMLPAQGRVLWDDRDPFAGPPSDLRRLRSGIGFVHQDFRLVPQLRVLQNVLCGRLGRWSFARSLRTLVAPPEHVVMEVHALLDKLGIADKLYQRTDRLSGGQQQRVAVARALFQRPSLLIADEPVSAVDPARSRQVLDLLRTEARERSMTLLLSLHDTELARGFPRWVGLGDGRVRFCRRPAEVGEQELAALYADAEESVVP